MGAAMDGEKVHADCARRRMSDVTESVRVLTEPRVQHAPRVRAGRGARDAEGGRDT